MIPESIVLTRSIHPSRGSFPIDAVPITQPHRPEFRRALRVVRHQHGLVPPVLLDAEVEDDEATAEEEAIKTALFSRFQFFFFLQVLKRRLFCFFLCVYTRLSTCFFFLCVGEECVVVFSSL